MKRVLSSQEWQQLSDYIDQQLEPQLITPLEQKIQQRPEIKEAYLDLMVNKKILKSLPKHKAPRNFTLSPEMVVDRKKGFSIFRTLNLVSGFCLFFFLFTYILQPNGSFFPSGDQISLNSTPLAGSTPQIRLTDKPSGLAQIPAIIGSSKNDHRKTSEANNPNLHDQPTMGPGDTRPSGHGSDSRNVLTGFFLSQPIDWVRLVIVGVGIGSFISAGIVWIRKRH